MGRGGSGPGSGAPEGATKEAAAASSKAGVAKAAPKPKAPPRAANKGKGKAKANESDGSGDSDAEDNTASHAAKGKATQSKVASAEAKHDRIREALGEEKWNTFFRDKDSTWSSIRDFPRYVCQPEAPELSQQELEKRRVESQSQQCFELGCKDFHFDHQNLANVANFKPPTWWEGYEYDWNLADLPDLHEDQMPNTNMKRKTKEKFLQQRLPGQTVFAAIQAGNPNSANIAAICRFKTTKDLAIFSDTVGADLLGGLCKLREWDSFLNVTTKGFQSWDKVLGLLKSISVKDPSHHHSVCAAMMEMVGQMDAPEDVLIRAGDVESGPSELLPLVHGPMTILAYALQFLKFAPISNQPGAPARFKTMDRNSDASIFGYSADDWIAAFSFIIYHWSRRQGKNCLDSTRQPDSAELTYPRASLASRGGIVTEEQGALLPENKKFQAAADYMEMYRADARKRVMERTNPVKPVAIQDSDDESDEEVAVSKSDKWIQKINNRLALFHGFGQQQSMSVKETLRKRGNHEGMAKTDPLDPLDEGSLKKVISMGKLRFPDAKSYGVDAEAVKAMGSSLQPDHVAAFIAAQDGVAERIAEVKKENNGITTEEARRQTNHAINQSYVMSQLVSTTKPRDVDFKEACASVGIEIKDWDNWDPEKDLRIAKHFGIQDSTIDVFAPHQIADAYELRRRKKSLVRGALLANDVGTGKTGSIFLLVWATYLEYVAAQARGEEVVAYPTLMEVPSALVYQTFDEARKFFGQKFKILVHYGQPKDAGSNSDLKDAICADREFDKVMGSCVRNPNNPKNALIVVISSYTTLSSRWMFPHHEIRRIKEPRKPDELDVYNRAKHGKRRGQKRATVSKEAAAYKRRKRAEASRDLDAEREDDEDADFEEEEELELDDADLDSEDEDSEELLRAKRARRTELEPPDDDFGDDDGDDERHFTENGEEMIQYTRYTCRPSTREIRFERVVMDEAQCIRNPYSVAARMNRLLLKKSVVMMTATPTLNHIRDFRGYVMQIRHVCALPISMDFDGRVDLDTYDPLMDVGDLADDADDPTMGEDVWTTSDPVERRKVRDFCQEHSVQVWYLSEQICRHLDSKDMNVACRIFKALVAILQTKRTMNTALTLPGKDQVTVFPGSKVPPMEISTEELQHDKVDGGILASISNAFKAKIMRIDQDDDHMPQHVEGETPQEKKAKLDYGVIRMLTLVCANLRLLDVMNLEDAISGLESRALQEILSLKGLGYTTTKPTKKSREKEKKQAQKNKGIPLGVRHTQAIIEQDPDGGLSYQFTLLNHEQGVLPPTNRGSFLIWAMAKSPLYTRVFELVTQYVHTHKERVLLVVNNQFNQQEMFAILTMAGFDCAMIRSSYNPKERIDEVKRFTSSGTGCQIFIMNLENASNGLNLHYDCHRGIMMQSPPNHNTQLQAIGRLIRLGQTRVVTWVVMRVNGSFYDYMELRNNRKMIQEVVTLAEIPDWIKQNDLRTLVGYEILRGMLAHPFNRYPWQMREPAMVEEYNSDTNRQRGALCTVVAKLVCTLTPEQQQEFESLEELGVILDELIQQWPSLGGKAQDLDWESLKGLVRDVMDEQEQSTIPDYFASEPKGKGKRGQQSTPSSSVVQVGRGLAGKRAKAIAERKAQQNLLSSEFIVDSSDEEPGVDDAAEGAQSTAKFKKMKLRRRRGKNANISDNEADNIAGHISGLHIPSGFDKQASQGSVPKFNRELARLGKSSFLGVDPDNAQYGRGKRNRGSGGAAPDDDSADSSPLVDKDTKKRGSRGGVGDEQSRTVKPLQDRQHPLGQESEHDSHFEDTYDSDGELSEGEDEEEEDISADL